MPSKLDYFRLEAEMNMRVKLLETKATAEHPTTAERAEYALLKHLQGVLYGEVSHAG